jgi:small GTP-binding protein
VCVRLVVAGDGACGKTSAVSRYVGDGVRSTYHCSTGLDFKIKLIEIPVETLEPGLSGTLFARVQIWATVGQERLRRRWEGLKSVYAHANALLVCCDVTSPAAAEEVANTIRQMDAAGRPPDIPLYILATKTDRSDRVVSTEDVERIAREHGAAAYFETSAGGC